MIKAEVIEYPGAEVPNWVAKCKDILSNPSAVGTLALLVLIVIGGIVWQSHRSAYTASTTVQSQPVSSSDLVVIPATAAVLSNQSQVDTQPANASSGASVGPAPTNSLSSLQSTGTAQTGSSFTQAAGQTVQSAGNATLDSLQNIGL